MQDLKNSLFLKYPASWWGAKWREALPSGNGPIGAAVYGAVNNETILLTHEDLWHVVKTPELPDVSDRLPEVRELMYAGKPEEAAEILADAMKAQGYEPDIGYPLPLADLKIHMPVQKGFRNYRRTLDMETGEVLVSWKDDGVSYSRKLFVSRTDDVIVMEIRSEDGPLDVELTLDLHDRSDLRTYRHAEAKLPEAVEVYAEESGIIRYAARNDDGTEFGAVARVFTRDGQLSVDSDKIQISEGNSALVVIKLFVNEDRKPAWQRLKGELAEVSMNYESLLAPHAAVHSELFERVQLDLGAGQEAHKLSNEELLLDAYEGEAPTAMVEKMWAYGRYLLISSSREGGQPCHLLGNWFGEYVGFWAFNMANENLQMIYWQALSGQLPETLLPVFDYYDRMMDDFRENARKIYGCRGIYVPAVTTPPSGLLKTVLPHIIHWTGGAAWIGHHYFDYFLYTGDEDFLRERALPFLRETVLFYEDFFTLDENGYFSSAPSNSPENTPGNYWDGKGMGAAMETTINPTMDFALAKEALTHLIEGSKLLGLYPDELDKWQGMLTKIPPYQINEDGAVSEWMHPFFEDNYHHRHQSHIYPVFPGAEVTRASDPKLFEAFKVAIEKRLVVGISEQTGWSLAHMACIWVRMHDGDQALECLDLLSRSSLMNNFYTTHNDWRDMGIGVELDWAPFQIDANMGWTNAVQQMLMYSMIGRVKVLSALPSKWKKGSVKGLHARGGVDVSIEWDTEVNITHIDLLSPRDQSLDVDAYAGKHKIRVDLVADQPLRITIDATGIRTLEDAVST